MSENAEQKIDKLRKDFDELKKAITAYSETWADTTVVKNLQKRIEALEKKIAPSGDVMDYHAKPICEITIHPGRIEGDKL